MYLIFDIGGTNIRAAFSKDGLTFGPITKIPTPQNFKEAVKALNELAEPFLKEGQISASVIGLPGPLDFKKSMLLSAPHLKDWNYQPLKQTLSDIWKVPVFLEHDADLEGLGEVHFGAGKNYQIVANLVIGTGIAATRIVEGKIDRNAFGFELTHQIIVKDGNPCDCGGKGHLEAYVSGSGIRNFYGKKGEDIKDPVIWEKVAQYLAVGLNNVAVVWSPEVIILSGGIMKNIPFEKMMSFFKQELKIFPTAPKVIPGQLGELSALYGGLQICTSHK